MTEPTETPFGSCTEAVSKIAAPVAHHLEGAAKAARCKASAKLKPPRAGKVRLKRRLLFIVITPQQGTAADCYENSICARAAWLAVGTDVMQFA